ncbi:hypothetical protein NQ317_016528 [Molorchus minor]|uniref:Uncharacterized protein n=1 Tax=Molorchus minor TaxID=1323400 RepID=A0ABQ9JV00_9CUCU|nr:hypothetical protein NQ317_016528 [Molorchus minor]
MEGRDAENKPHASIKYYNSKTKHHGSMRFAPLDFTSIILLEIDSSSGDFSMEGRDAEKKPHASIKYYNSKTKHNSSMRFAPLDFT